MAITRTQTKEIAQNSIMSDLANGLLVNEVALERSMQSPEWIAEQLAILVEQRKQATRVAVFLGYEMYPGVCKDGKPIETKINRNPDDEEN